jgi:hypothetical protein
LATEGPKTLDFCLVARIFQPLNFSKTEFELHVTDAERVVGYIGKLHAAKDQHHVFRIRTDPLWMTKRYRGAEGGAAPL